MSINEKSWMSQMAATNELHKHVEASVIFTDAKWTR